MLRSASSSISNPMDYRHLEVEKKWRESWKKSGLYRTGEDTSKEKFYVLDMFPYPSGEGLHVGHPKGYIATDIIARRQMMLGKNVLHPMGMDAFGLPAENYALKNKVHPSVAVKRNVERFKEQLDILGFTYDWEREVNTTDPAYYRWTQWAFVKMFENGLAYESFEPINWCPSCKTGLANEDLEDGRCERCGSEIEKKPLRQWVLRITKYADRLLADLDDLDWPEAIKESQRNWIGRSEGSEVDFKLESGEGTITVFTTRIDTLYGVTYVVLAPEHPLVENSLARAGNRLAVEQYIAASKVKTAIERTSEGKTKTGVELEGVRAIHPLTGESLPVWIANYVLADYGTGAVMAVPAHDDRDYEFAVAHKLPIKQVIAPFFVDRDNPPLEGKEWVPRRNVHAIIKHPTDDTIIQLQWKQMPWKTLVVGGVEDEESYEDAVVREVREETGFKNFKSIEPLGWQMEAHFYAGHKDINRKSFPRFFVMTLADLEQEPLSEEEANKHEIAWVPMSDLGKTFWPISELPEVLAHLEKGPHAFVSDGVLINSGEFDGLTSGEARERITERIGRSVVRYKLRDWVFSRQRYWGEPIPIIHCEKCGPVAVPEKDLPVVLPQVESYEPSGTGESPLATIPEWVDTTCPKCGGAGKRETNTMPQWAGSSWYYLRYIDPKNDTALVDPKKEAYWSPVDVYVGGAEHATRHLIYARFWHKFLYDIGIVSHSEPFKRYTNLGLLMGEDGRKMSKRWGNVINPDEMVARYGADAFRLYEMFIGPFIQSAAFKESGVAGAHAFLKRVWQLFEKVGKADDQKLSSLVHKTIKKVGDNIDTFRFNTAVSSLMILANALGDAADFSRESYETLLKLLSPFAPHLCEELWHQLGNDSSIFLSGWPACDESLLVDDILTIAVQVNGKLRDTFDIGADADDAGIQAAALAREKVQPWIDGKEIKKVVVVKGRLVSIVV